MGAKIARRIVSFLLTLLMVSLFVFGALSFAPGDSSSFVLSEEASEEEVEAYRIRAGLGQSFLIRYLRFLHSFFTLEWGESIGGESIRKMILSRIPVTISLTFFSILLSLLISLPVVFFSLRRLGRRSPLVTVLSSTFYVVPTFISSVILVLVFGLWLKLFPVAGYKTIKEGIFLHLRSLFLPSLTLSLLHSSLIMRLLAEALEESLSMPYTRTALSKGVQEKKLVASSAMKPVLPIFLTIISDSIARGLGGSVVVESVFALPGIGSLLIRGAVQRDSVLVAVTVMVSAFFVSLSFLLADIASFLSDPRQRRLDEKD